MSACFYNNAGTMTGIDGHKYMALVPPNPLPTPGLAIYIAGAAFRQGAATFYKRTATLTSDGHKMLMGGFDLYLVFHIPVFPLLPALMVPPHPAELLNTAAIIADSGSKAQLQAHSVTYKNAPLATCIAGPAGLNVNCWDSGLSAPSGVVVNMNSVITSPTWGDYFGAIAGWIADMAIGVFIDAAPGPIKHLWRRVGDIPFLSIRDYPSHIQNFVQRLVDDGPEAAVDGLVEDAKKSITDPIDKAKELADKYLK